MKFPKPPSNIPPKVLFGKVEQKVFTILSNLFIVKVESILITQGKDIKHPLFRSAVINSLEIIQITC